MSERKVLTKYYPPDFDPSALGRVRGPKRVGPKVQTVRLMAPFSMRCLRCGEYIYRGRKFNARKETPPDDRYLGIQIFRFYIKCTRCSAEITFKTDPKNQDYACERGAKRTTEPWKQQEGAGETDEQRLDRLEREAQADEQEEQRNAMAELEAKTQDARREMAVADALDEIRTRNARLERADKDGADAAAMMAPTPLEDEAARQEREDEEAARRAFAMARSPGADTQEEPLDGDGLLAASGTPEASSAAQAMPPPSFKRVVKKKKDRSAALGIKKKPSLV
ncbi:CWC16 protein [Xylariaceae sp. FL0804]|nr:CWC16 protein [Xylariaceae sp. FL0804]